MDTVGLLTGDTVSAGRGDSGGVCIGVTPQFMSALCGQCDVLKAGTWRETLLEPNNLQNTIYGKTSQHSCRSGDGPL